MPALPVRTFLPVSDSLPNININNSLFYGVENSSRPQQGALSKLPQTLELAGRQTASLPKHRQSQSVCEALSGGPASREARRAPNKRVKQPASVHSGGKSKSRPWGERSQLHEVGMEPAGQLPQRAKDQGASSHPDLSLQELLNFERKGHLRVPGLLDPGAVGALQTAVMAAAEAQKLQAYRHRVAVLCPRVDPSLVRSVRDAERILAQHSDSPLGFLQTFNLHRTVPMVARLAASRALAGTAASLLGCKKLRLYQDCLFLKLPGFGATNWHSDLNMVPLDTNAFLTAWIPLHEIGPQDSLLSFASGSHRDFALPYWQSNEGMEMLERRGYPVECHKELELGDMTFHHGWTLHWAPPQPSHLSPRAALTFCFFADGARVLDTSKARRKPHTEDDWGHQHWRRDLKEGQVARHPELPLVWPPKTTSS